jgi:hypothetical protein
MYEQKFINGEPVPTEYLAAIHVLIAGACEAEDLIGLDELERHVRQYSPREVRQECALTVLLIDDLKRHVIPGTEFYDIATMLPVIQPEYVRLCANDVFTWSMQPERTAEEITAAQKFLAQWPEGPQIIRLPVSTPLSRSARRDHCTH